MSTTTSNVGSPPILAKAINAVLSTWYRVQETVNDVEQNTREFGLVVGDTELVAFVTVAPQNRT